MEETILSVEKLVKRYGENTVLDGVSFGTRFRAKKEVTA